jgi:hypothetical protein
LLSICIQSQRVFRVSFGQTNKFTSISSEPEENADELQDGQLLIPKLEPVEPTLAMNACEERYFP